MQIENRQRRVGPEWGHTGQQLEEDRTQRIEVRLFGRAASGGAFGRDVGRGSRRVEFMLRGRAGVENLNLTTLKLDVLGREIAML